MELKHFPIHWATAIISGDRMCMTLLPFQAQARCHRIGQSKAVKVYRLITRNSYEREMFDKASLKLGLDKAVLQDINRKGSTNGVSMTVPALELEYVSHSWGLWILPSYSCFKMNSQPNSVRPNNFVG